jgi:hypothetical protein
MCNDNTRSRCTRAARRAAGALICFLLACGSQPTEDGGPPVGTVVQALAGAQCADGTQEQTFPNGMAGCAGAVSFANRGTLCAPGSRVATAAEWAALHAGIAPTYNYWTNDALKYNGSGSASCFVSTSVGTDCGATPMRVCVGTDPQGNTCNWTHCGINATTPDQFFGGCVGNTLAGALCVPNTGCADGSVEQVFPNGMVGCAGAVTYANRATLCASGYQPATSAQWVADRGTAAPTHDYWTADALKYSGSGPAACSVSTTVGTDCGTTPMRVCTAAGTDAEGNQCNWQHCGLGANTPDEFFGGCVGNTTAGTVCAPSSCGALPATIDFEHYPDGTATCSNCPVTDEFACWGVTFAFESIVSNGTQRPNWCQLQGPTTNNPTSTPTHIVTNGSLTAVPAGFPNPPDPLAGYDGGTIVMTFGSSPTSVVFTAVVNNSIALSSSNVTASGVGGAPAVAVAAGAPYTPSGSTVVFRRDTITVTAAASGTITSVRIAAPGFIALIDDMRISP